jgi:hypothetical protein
MSKESSAPAERRGSIWPIQVSTCASAVAQGALLLLLPLDGLATGGIFAGFAGPGMLGVAGDFAPAKGRAEFIGVWRLWSDAGSAVAPFVMGAIAELLVLGAAGAVTAGLGLGGMLVMAYAVREPLAREPSNPPAA